MSKFGSTGLPVSAPRPLLDRPSSHDALEILKRDPAAEFSGPKPRLVTSDITSHDNRRPTAPVSIPPRDEFWQLRRRR